MFTDRFILNLAPNSMPTERERARLILGPKVEKDDFSPRTLSPALPFPFATKKFSALTSN
jgi:hypothetical protein